jgi:hypothetical protein
MVIAEGFALLVDRAVVADPHRLGCLAFLLRGLPVEVKRRSVTSVTLSVTSHTRARALPLFKALSDLIS